MHSPFKIFLCSEVYIPQGTVLKLHCTVYHHACQKSTVFIDSADSGIKLPADDKLFYHPTVGSIIPRPFECYFFYLTISYENLTGKIKNLLHFFLRIRFSLIRRAARLICDQVAVAVIIRRINVCSCRVYSAGRRSCRDIVYGRGAAGTNIG